MKIDFKHRQSAHCENGVISNLMEYHGFQVSEPMVFGIGSGLLFCYIPFVKINYAPLITYRAMAGFIFKRFAKRVGITIKREKFKDPKRAKDRLDQNLAKDNPVGLQVGVYNLTYFPDEYRFHFNAHNLVVYGKDDDTYLISDPVMQHTTTLTAEELEKVRYAKGPFAPKGHMYYPVAFPKTLELEKAIKKGIRHTCREMLAPVPIVGAKGVKTVAKMIRKWPKKHGSKKTNHYLGQIVRMQEEIGTGGGGFRYIYAAFLQEASTVLNNPSLAELSQQMTEIGDQWRDFALDASRLYKNRSVESDGYTKVADQLEAIGDREAAFFAQLKKTI
ncbi:BtrH N-terminal domain-containing protein [Maribacter sp. 2-571]|uniref:BtrH N-terminal domain-containing protein n=1 Tax=Maribacter sp. 2-571 TaxID=3417569 RepID=UPI003D335D42